MVIPVGVMWSLPQTSGLGRKKDLVQVAWLHVRGLRWRGFTSRELRWRGFTSRGLGDTRLLETSAELRSQGQGGEPPAGCEQSHDSGELQGGCGPGFRSPLCLCFGCHRNNTVSSSVPLFLSQSLTRPFTVGNYR